jgi:Flp pilus assembly protein TadD
VAAGPGHQAYVGKGVIYRLMGDYDSASRLYSKALEIAPDNAEVQTSVGVLAIHKGDYETAVSHLKKAIKLNDALAVAHSNLAIAYAATGYFDDADQELKKAIVRGYHQPEVIKEKIDQFQRVLRNND